jgi:hypothetical protein
MRNESAESLCGQILKLTQGHTVEEVKLAIEGVNSFIDKCSQVSEESIKKGLADLMEVARQEKTYDLNSLDEIRHHAL